MQAAELFNDLQSRAQVKMIRVRQHDLRLHVDKIFGADAFDGAVGPDGHEERRLDLAVGRRDRAKPGFGFGICFVMLEKHNVLYSGPAASGLYSLRQLKSGFARRELPFASPEL